MGGGRALYFWYFFLGVGGVILRIDIPHIIFFFSELLNFILHSVRAPFIKSDSFGSIEKIQKHSEKICYE